MNRISDCRLRPGASGLDDDRHLKPRSADWRAFAAAAGAALAATSAADAAIIYSNTSVDVKLPGSAPYNASVAVKQPFTIAGFAENAIVERGPAQGSVFTNYAGVSGNAQFFGVGSTNRLALKFANGASIGGSYPEALAAFQFRNPNQVGGSDGGYFKFGQTGIAGFKLPNGDLGWIRVEVIDRNGDNYPDELKFLGAAYNDVPGAPISAGQTTSSVPEPSTTALALLAAGSAGVLAWRKRRTAAQADPR